MVLDNSVFEEGTPLFSGESRSGFCDEAIALLFAGEHRSIMPPADVLELIL